MIRTFRDAIREISPPWLRRGTAEKVLYALAIQFDGLADAAVAAVKYRFPGFYGFESLPYLSRDRRIQRGRYEDDATFAERLLGWLEVHQVRGGPYPLLRQLHAHFAPQSFKIELIYASGRRFTLETDGTISWDHVDWTPPGDPNQWARWWLFYHAPSFVSNINWDDGQVWDEGYVWGSGLTPADVADLRMIPDALNAAHSIGHIVLLDEGEEWNTHAAGEWPHTIALRGHMTTPLTPADSFDTSVIPPETGLPVAAGVVSAALQKLLNRGEWLKNRLASLTADTTRRICWVYPEDGTVADGVLVPISIQTSYAGSTESWSLTSNEVQVPVAGIYRVDASLIVGNSADLSNPATCNVWVQAGATTIGWIVGKRFADGDDSFHANGHALVTITDPATQKLKLRNGTGGMIWFDSYSPHQAKAGPVIIEYVGPV